MRVWSDKKVRFGAGLVKGREGVFELCVLQRFFLTMFEV